MEQPPILDTRIIPPTSLQERIKFYCSRYGMSHVLCSLIGRKYHGFWHRVGPIASQPYLKRYLGKENDIILNLGGGSNINEKYLTADIDPRADVYTNIMRPLPFPDESVSHIMLEEVIEHIPYENAKNLVNECYRILKPNGCFRVITPDFAYYAHAANERDEVDEMNDVFYNHGHQYIFTKKKLDSLVTAAGFTKTCFTDYLDPESKLGYLDSHPYRFNHVPEISMYLEAFKV